MTRRWDRRLESFGLGTLVCDGTVDWMTGQMTGQTMTVGQSVYSAIGQLVYNAIGLISNQTLNLMYLPLHV